MKKEVKIVVLFFILSLSLQAEDSYHLSHKEMKNHHEFFEKLTPKEREMVMDLKAEFMHKEAHLNSEMRKLRAGLNSCMTGEEVDMDEYRELRERVQELKEQRKKLRMEYREQIFYIIEKQHDKWSEPIE